ncbi:MAG: hypothetical protein KF712_09240 [Akkermansiaceae bacterium]|nr:hypothetical protein [Akkermansiaceae bacterium]
MNDLSSISRGTGSPCRPIFVLSLLLLFVTFHLVSWKLGYREGIDLQYYPAYQEAAQGGWLCLASMDSVSLPDVSKPYSGWPVLYGYLLAAPSKAGIPYEAGVMITNIFIGLCSAGVLYRLLKATAVTCTATFVVLSICLAGAYWSSANTAFSHRLIPFGMLAGALSWVLWRNAALDAGRCARYLWMMRSFSAGVLVGTTNWSCFFIVPAVALVALALQPVTRDRSSFFRDIKWCFAFGSGTIAAFVLFKLLHSAAVHDSGALAAPLSGTSSRILARMIPSVRDVAGTLFFATLRSSWALIPLLPLVISWKFKLPGRPAAVSPRHQVLAVLILAFLLFIFVLSGEMAMAAHRFYVILFLAPAAYAFNIFSVGRSVQRRSIAAILCLGTSCFSLFGHMLLPRVLSATPRQAHLPAGYINPGSDFPFALGAETYDLPSVLRTALRQWTLTPVRQLKPGQNISARQRDWFRGAGPAIRASCPPDGLLIGCSADLAMETYECGRPLVFANTLVELEAYLTRLKPLAGQNRITLAIHKEMPAEITAILSKAGLQAQPVSKHQDVIFCILKAGT